MVNYIIPSGVTSIGDLVFYGCNSLTSIILPSSVTIIGMCAFDVCISLENVYYTGTEAQWNTINIGYFNSGLASVTIHYNSAGK